MVPVSQVATLATISLRGAIVLLFLGVPACTDDTAEECLPEEEPRDPATIDPVNAPFCDTTLFNIHNSRPEYAFGPSAITVCREPQDGKSCDGCDPEDWEADLLARGEEYLAESSAPACECNSKLVDHMEPECFLETDDGLCCYRALIWSNTCEYYVIADEPDDAQCESG